MLHTGDASMDRIAAKLALDLTLFGGHFRICKIGRSGQSIH